MERVRNIILAVFFFALIGITAVATGVWKRFPELITMCVQPLSAQRSARLGDEDVEMEGASEQPAQDVADELSLVTVEDNLLDDLPYKNALVELSGTVMKTAGVRSYYNTESGINVSDSGYIISQYAYTSTDYEVEQMIEFKEYLDEQGIGLLYVNEPSKYIDDSYYQEQFGGESYLNRNADIFLSRIGEAGIEYIDLRDNERAEGLNPESLFYRTDHHWTVPTAKWAAEIIAERLNEDYGYRIDLSLYDDDRFNKVSYEDAWLGEQGKKVGKSYIGLDNYTMMEPLYETSYTISGSSDEEGDFGIFIKKDVYDTEADVYEASSWHYSYQGYTSSDIHNNNANYGNVLVLGDSYEAAMVPFLTLGIEDVTYVVPRNLTDQTVREIVDAGDYDTVIMAYAQFMIGAHDDEKNANYKMFVLD